MTGWVFSARRKSREFIEQHRYTFPVAFDEGSRLTDRYEIKNLPTVLVIDQTDRIHLQHIGYSTKLANHSLPLSEQINALLNERRAAQKSKGHGIEPWPFR